MTLKYQSQHRQCATCGHTKAQHNFCETVNQAISHHYPFYVYRTIEGKVEQCEVYALSLVGPSIDVDYKTSQGPKFGPASVTDLQIFSQQAKTYGEKAREAQAKKGAN